MLMQKFEGTGGPEVAPGSDPQVPSTIDVADESALAGAIADMVTRGGRLIDLSALSRIPSGCAPRRSLTICAACAWPLSASIPADR